MRIVVDSVIGVVLAVLAMGLALLMMTGPEATASLSRTYSQAQEAGISESQALKLAEQVRAFVVDGEGALPETVAGREGFSADAVSHLEDVRSVIAASKVATAASAMIVMVWLLVMMGRRRLERVASGLKAGGVATAVLIGVLALAGMLDFDSFFVAFHGVFFDAGTWTFPADSLLIRLFPEGFWSSAAVRLGGWTVAFAGAWWLLGAWLARTNRAEKA